MRGLERSRSELLEASALPRLQGGASTRHPRQELRMILQAVFEPIVFGLKSNQHARRSPMARDQDLLISRRPEVAREVILDLRQGDLPGRACLALRARPQLGLSR